jgi:single-strand DNA-binding protein
VTAFRALAEGCIESLTKGDKIIVVGTIKESSWEKDGAKQTRLEVTADSIGKDVTGASRMQRVTKPELTDAWSTDPF